MDLKSNLISGGAAANARLRFLRLREVVKRVGVSKASIARWENEGTFPRRRKLGLNSVAWVEQEIDDWCAERAQS